MAARIYPKRPSKFYLREWRERKGLTQEQLAGRLGEDGVAPNTIGRYEAWCAGERGKEARRPDIEVWTALAEALGISPADLHRHPDTPSADDLLRRIPRDEAQTFMRMLKRAAGDS